MDGRRREAEVRMELKEARAVWALELLAGDEGRE